MTNEISEFLAEVRPELNKQEKARQKDLADLLEKADSLGWLSIILQLQTGNLVTLRVPNRRQDFVHMAIAEYIPELNPNDAKKIEGPDFLLLDEKPNPQSIANNFEIYMNKHYSKFQKIKRIDFYNSTAEFLGKKPSTTITINNQDQAA